LAVPVGWGLLGEIYCLNQLTTAPSPIEENTIMNHKEHFTTNKKENTRRQIK
jgi:hypothetical protein